MRRTVLHAALLVGVATMLTACGGNKEKATFQAAVDSMSTHRDSTINALDSTKGGVSAGQIDTTKLGAAKTESILTKARKTP
jgi:hypothetical protein